MLEVGSSLSPTCGIGGIGVHLEQYRPNTDPLSPKRSLAYSQKGTALYNIEPLLYALV